jgi:mannose/fructose-specific phosphotransferase system component IIA
VTRGRLRGVVVAHGSLAQAMVEAVEQITGVRDALTAVSNTGCDRGVLEQRIRQAVGADPALVFVDLPSGSCFFAVMHGLEHMPEVRMLTGVNLTMLVDFVFHRDDSLDRAAARAREVGGRAIAGA